MNRILKMKNLILILLLSIITISGCIENKSSTNPTVDKTPVSTSFNEDFGQIICNPVATSLQKENLDKIFDEKYRNKYVVWTGIVKEVSEDKLFLSQCGNIYAVLPDVSIVMREDQKSKLMQLSQYETVTYKARLFRYGSTLGIYGDDGEIITDTPTPPPISTIQISKEQNNGIAPLWDGSLQLNIVVGTKVTTKDVIIGTPISIEVKSIDNLSSPKKVYVIISAGYNEEKEFEGEMEEDGNIVKINNVKVDRSNIKVKSIINEHDYDLVIFSVYKDSDAGKTIATIPSEIPNNDVQNATERRVVATVPIN